MAAAELGTNVDCFPIDEVDDLATVRSSRQLISSRPPSVTASTRTASSDGSMPFGVPPMVYSFESVLRTNSSTTVARLDVLSYDADRPGRGVVHRVLRRYDQYYDDELRRWT